MNRTTAMAVFAVLLAGPAFAQVTIDLAPVFQLSVGQPYAPQVCISELLPTDTTVDVASSDPLAISAPASVVIPAGSLCTAVTLTANGVGTPTITVTAPTLGNITDNEIIPSKYAINTWSDWYVAPGQTGLGHVCISAARAVPVVVTLTNNEPSFATVPPSVTIPALATCVDYPITGVTEGQATVRAELPPELGGLFSALSVTIVTPRDLEITGSASPTTVVAGTNVLYTLTATNHSSISTDVRISLPPIGTLVTSTNTPLCTPPDPFMGSANIDCTRTPLAAGASVTFTVTVTAETPGVFTSNVTIAAVNPGQPDPDTTNNATAIVTTVLAPGIGFSEATYSVNENAGPATIPIVRSSATSSASVTFTASAGTATAGTDFTTVSQTVNFLAGESTKNVSVPIVNDTGVETDETVQLALTGASDASPNRTATLYLRDDESRRPADLGVTIGAPASVTGGATITYTVTGTNYGPNPMSAGLYADHGLFVSTTLGSCYDTGFGPSCDIPTLTVGQNVTITLTDTAPLDGSSVPNHAAINGPGVSSDPVAGNNSASVVTATQRNFAFSKPAYSVEEGIPTLSTKVIRFNSSGAASVTFSTLDIASATAGADYTPVNTAVNFANGENSKTVNIAIAVDYIVEGNELFDLTLTGATDGSPDQRSRVTIVDHDFSPTITSLVPATASTVGGQSITINGTNLAGATVTFGGTPVSVTSSTATAIVCTTPAHAAGVVEVKVTTVAGFATTSITYVALPTIATVSPAEGPLSGGQTVTITGTNLTGATAMLGTTSATVTGTTSTTVTLTTPSHAAGAVDVKVTTTAGQATKSGGYTYRAAPTISTINPAAGPLTGGQSVTISGTNLAGATLTVGGTPVVPTSTAASSIVFTTPPHGAGAVNLIVSTLGGSVTSTGGYVYYAAPIVSSFSPTSGARGAQVTITGSNFTGATGVQFNGAAAGFTVTSATQITATVPVGATTGAITVTNPGGIGASSANFSVLLHGDANGDGKLTPADVFLLVNYLFASGPAPNGDGDTSGDGFILPNDVFLLISSVFGGG